MIHREKLKTRLGIIEEQDQESLLFRHKKEFRKFPFLCRRLLEKRILSPSIIRFSHLSVLYNRLRLSSI